MHMLTQLDIAGITIALEPSTGILWSANKAFRRFESHRPPWVHLAVAHGDVDLHPQARLVFQSGGLWSLYGLVDGWQVALKRPPDHGEFYQVATYSSDFTTGILMVRPHTGRNAPDGGFPLAFPAGELLVINLLARGRGVMVHSCGLALGEHGVLFVGKSGAGKSTTAQLWSEVPGVTILSDDRIILRKHDGRFWIYGTPFHGTAEYAEPQGVPLERILFLRHSGDNWVKDVRPAAAAARLFAGVFPPAWSKAGTQFTVDFLAGLSQSIRCSDFGFRPDKSAVGFVADLME